MKYLYRLLLTILLTLTLCSSTSGIARADGAGSDQIVLPAASGWPLADGGPPVIVRGFDPPDQDWNAGHRGTDLAGRVGQSVHAAAAGTVAFAGPLAGQGVLVIDHGSVRTTYQPVTAAVRVGQRVQTGEVIGTLQAGEHCRRACLHWGLKRGEDYLNPLTMIGPGVGAGVVAGPVRLLPRDAVAAVVARARVRAALPVTTRPAAHGFVFPVAGQVTSPYGMRVHPITGVYKLHDGTDFGAACGTPIRSPAAGVVTGAYYQPGYGNRLLIDHGAVAGRHVQTAMNHASHYLVAVGDRVGRGQLLGYVGQTGYATGCHLHLMLWLDGPLVDPLSWFGSP